ncbi:gas vesicle protein GvpO [Streptomyces sp. NBC_00344]|uniref:gas vesicle protein GvpO n=1 Tax=Streptomyces sp. NBC_00344 TaxID=2975720 RepID=UPI002E20F48B
MAEQRVKRAGSGKSAAASRTSDLRGAERAALRASESLSRLIDHPPEGVSGVCRSDDEGWRVCVDVLEVARIPDTTSLLATYEVELDADGHLLQYRRVRRYRRGAADI